MRISDRVRIVGSGTLGFQISDPIDCNVYLIDAGTEYVLIDAGGGVNPEQIVDNIERDGVSMGDVTHLLLTHVHADHAAGSYFFWKSCGLQIVCSDEAATWLEEGDAEKISLTKAIAAGVYPRGFAFPQCPVQRRVTDSEVIGIGDLNIQVVATPGHSNGHICYLMEEDGARTLFSGDAVFARGKIVIQNTWDCRIQAHAESVKKLCDLHIDRMYPGHGPFLWSDAYKHIQMAQDYFNRLEVPPNL